MFGFNDNTETRDENPKCIDFTALNKNAKREVYPLPSISDMLTRLSKGRVFSKLNANSEFWQIKIDSESKLLTTFVTSWGRFCFRRMPFEILWWICLV